MQSTIGPTLCWNFHALAYSYTGLPSWHPEPARQLVLHACRPRTADIEYQYTTLLKMRMTTQCGREGQAHLLAQAERGPGWACLACWQSPTCRWAQKQSNGLQRHLDMPCSQNCRCTLLLMTSASGVSTSLDKDVEYNLDMLPQLYLASCQTKH